MEYTRGGKHVKKEGEATLPTTSVQCQVLPFKIISLLCAR